MDAFLPFLLATVVGSTVAVVGYLVAVKAGLGPVQGALVGNLEKNNQSLVQRVELLEEDLQRERRVRARLARKVVRLERTVLQLSEENGDLRSKLNMPRRRPIELAGADEEGDEGEDDDLEGEGGGS